MEAAAATGLRPFTAPLGAARRAGTGGGVRWRCVSGQRRLGRGTTNPAMDSGDAWGRSSSTSSSAAAASARRLQSRYDLYMDFDDADAGGGEVDARGAEAYNCPFCGEDFDFVGLCCHIDDEHAVEAKSGSLKLKQVMVNHPHCPNPSQPMRILQFSHSCFGVTLLLQKAEWPP